MDFSQIVRNLREKMSESHSSPNHKNSNVIIVDGMNFFIRCFIASPQMSKNGEHVGGYTTFIKSLAMMIRDIHPTRVIVVFDGKNGSVRRKKIYPEYKEGRKFGMNLNRPDTIGERTKEEEYDSMIQQLKRLIQYLETLPVSVISIDNIEADDTISYLATEIFGKRADSKVTILSDDKDFLQLTTDNIRVYRPVEKRMYSKNEVIAKFLIPPCNYIFLKCIDGDSSDNIKGVKGLGIKTMIKKFPLIFEDRKVELDEFIEFCGAEHEKNKKDVTFKKILENVDLLKLNWELMDLTLFNFSATYKSAIREFELDTKSNKLDSIKFKQLLYEDTIQLENDRNILQSFTMLNNFI